MNTPVTLSEHEGVRYLHLGTPWVQGAMRLAAPDRIELVYVQRMLAALLWLDPLTLHQGRAVQLGLGAGTLTRFAAKSLRMDTTAVEINLQVVAACRAMFRLPADGPRLRVVCADAAHWVAQAAQAEVRLLHVDLYDQEAAAPVLDDPPFYAGCRRLLEPGGVMAVNLFGRHASFERSAQHIAGVFGAEHVWRLQPTREGNTVLVAGRGLALPDRQALRERAQHIEHRWGQQGLAAAKWLRMIQPWQPAAAPRAPG